jgi:hypothetical protein
MSKKYLVFYVAVFLIFVSKLAYADAFIPTMISANVLWIVVLPLVVLVEGWFMARWKWEKPYKNSLFGNLWSMLAALPLGIGLSILGGYIRDAQTTFAFIPESARYLLASTFLYGQISAPSYDFIDDGFGYAGIALAALFFIGVCWLLTLGVEGYYYVKKNPLLPRGKVYGLTALVNIISYSLLLALWIPYSYHVASTNQESLKYTCSKANSMSSRCPQIWAKFPEIREIRINECSRRLIGEVDCLTGRYR